MKLLLIPILLAAVCSGLADTIAIPDIKLDSEIQNQLTRSAIQAFIRSYEQELVSLIQTQNSFDDSETRATLFPPFPDEDVPLEPFIGTFPEEFGDLFLGSYNFTDVVLKGTGNIEHDYNLILVPPATLKFNLSTETITLTGIHNTDISASAALFNISGQGPFDLSMINATIGMEMSVDLANDRVNFTRLEFDLAIPDIVANFTNTEVNDFTIDWDVFNENLNQLVQDNLWRVRDILRDLVLVQANNILEECLLSELIAGDISCILEALQPGTDSTEPATTPPPSDSAASKFDQVSGLMMILPVMYLFA